MRVFYTTSFSGHYPVGAAAVVVAPTEEVAYDMFVALLKEDGLWTQDNQLHFTLGSITEVDVTVPSSHMLVNGNY